MECRFFYVKTYQDLKEHTFTKILYGGIIFSGG